MAVVEEEETDVEVAMVVEDPYVDEPELELELISKGTPPGLLPPIPALAATNDGLKNDEEGYNDVGPIAIIASTEPAP